MVASAYSSLVLGYLRKDFAGVVKALGEKKLEPAKMITSKIKIDRVVEGESHSRDVCHTAVLTNHRWLQCLDQREGQACQDFD